MVKDKTKSFRLSRHPRVVEIVAQSMDEYLSVPGNTHELLTKKTKVSCGTVSFYRRGKNKSASYCIMARLSPIIHLDLDKILKLEMSVMPSVVRNSPAIETIERLNMAVLWGFITKMSDLQAGAQCRAEEVSCWISGRGIPCRASCDLLNAYMDRMGVPPAKYKYWGDTVCASIRGDYSEVRENPTMCQDFERALTRRPRRYRRTGVASRLGCPNIIAKEMGTQGKAEPKIAPVGKFVPMKPFLENLIAQNKQEISDLNEIISAAENLLKLIK